MYNENEYRKDYDRHINNAEQYRRYTSNLQWNNRKGSGERWKMDDIIKRSDVDFDREQYTPFDFAAAVNMLYSDYGDVSENMKDYMKMAGDYLKNDSYPERPDERMYYDAQRRQRRNRNKYENRYDSYNAYDTYDNYDNYDNYNRYDYDNRRRYNERNTYRDRDNDGNYREGR